MPVRSDGLNLLMEIHVTGFVGVVLVALFVLAVNQGRAARAMAMPAFDPGPLHVSVDRVGVYYIGERIVDEAALRARARGCPSAVLAADGDVRHAIVVRALHLLRDEDVTRVDLVIRAARLCPLADE